MSVYTRVRSRPVDGAPARTCSASKPCVAESDRARAQAVAPSEVRGPELALARQIIASLEAPFDPAGLSNKYRSSLRELLEAKLEGHELEDEGQPAAAETPVVDLMEALLASVSAAGKAPGKRLTAQRKRAVPARK